MKGLMAPPLTSAPFWLAHEERPGTPRWRTRTNERLDLGTWVEALSRVSVSWVTTRLSLEGQLRRGRGRLRRSRPLGERRGTADMPADSTAAVSPCARLSDRLEQGDSISTHDAVLLGPAVATGLTEFVMEGPSSAGPFAQRVVAHLPESLLDLVTVTETAVADDVLTNRA